MHQSKVHTSTFSSTNNLRWNPGYYHERIYSIPGLQSETNIPLDRVDLKALSDSRTGRSLNRERSGPDPDLKLPWFHQCTQGCHIALSKHILACCCLPQSQCQDANSDTSLQYCTAHYCLPAWKRPFDPSRYDPCSLPKKICSDYVSNPYGTLPPCHRMAVSNWELNGPLARPQYGSRKTPLNFGLTQPEYCSRQNLPVRCNNQFRSTKPWVNCCQKPMWQHCHQTMGPREYHSKLGKDHSRSYCIKPRMSNYACRPCSGLPGAPTNAAGRPSFERNPNPHALITSSRDAAWDQSNSFKHSGYNSFSSCRPSMADEHQKRNDFGGFVNNAHRRSSRRRYRRTLNARRRLTFERVEPPHIETEIREKNSETQVSSFWSRDPRKKEPLANGGKFDSRVIEKKIIHTQNPRELPVTMETRKPSPKIQSTLPKAMTSMTRADVIGAVSGKGSSISESMETTHSEATCNRNVAQALVCNLSISVLNQQKKVCEPVVAEQWVNSLSKDVNSLVFCSDDMNGPSQSETPSSSVPDSITGDLTPPSAMVELKNTPLSARKPLTTTLSGVHGCSQTVHVNPTSVDLSEMPTQNSTPPCQPVSLMPRTHDTDMLIRGRRVKCFLSSSGTVKSLSLLGKFTFMGSVSLKQGVISPMRPRFMHSLTPVKMQRVTCFTNKTWKTVESRTSMNGNMKAGKVKQCHGSTRKCAESIKTGASFTGAQTKDVHTHKLKVDPEFLANIKTSVAKLLRSKCVKTTAEQPKKGEQLSPEFSSNSRCLWDLYPSLNMTPQRCERPSTATVYQFQEKKAMDNHSLNACTKPWVGRSDTRSSARKASSSERKSLSAITLSDENDLHTQLISEKEREACQGIEEQSNFCPEISQGNMTDVESSVIQREPMEQLSTTPWSSLPLKLPSSKETGSVHTLTEDIQEIETKTDACSLWQRENKLNTCSALTDTTVVTFTPSRSHAEKRCSCHAPTLSTNQPNPNDLSAERPDPVPVSSPEVRFKTPSAQELDITISPPKLDAAADELNVSHDVDKSINSPNFLTPSPPILTPVLVPKNRNCSTQPQFASVSKETALYASACPEESLNILAGVCDMEKARIETERALSLKPVLNTATDVPTFTKSMFHKLNPLVSTTSPSLSSNTDLRSTVNSMDYGGCTCKFGEKRAKSPQLVNSCAQDTSNGDKDLIQHSKARNLNEKAAVNLENVQIGDIWKRKRKATKKSTQPKNRRYNKLMAEAKSRSVKERKFDHDVKGIVIGNIKETDSFRKSTRKRHYKKHDRMPFDYVSVDRRKGKSADKISLSCEALIKVTRIDSGATRPVIVDERQCCNVTDTAIASKEPSKIAATLSERKEDRAAKFSAQKSWSADDGSRIGKYTSMSIGTALSTVVQSPDFKRCRPLKIPVSRIQLDKYHGQTKQKGDKRRGFELSEKDSWNSADGQGTTSVNRISGKRLDFKPAVEGESHTNTGSGDQHVTGTDYVSNAKLPESCDSERLKAEDQNFPEKVDHVAFDGSVLQANNAEHALMNKKANASLKCVNVNQDFSEQSLDKECHQPKIQIDFTTSNKDVQGQSFVKAGSSVFPVRVISKPLISCKFCNHYSARSQPEVNWHVREAHPFRCYKCFKTFQSKPLKYMLLKMPPHWSSALQLQPMRAFAYRYLMLLNTVPKIFHFCQSGHFYGWRNWGYFWRKGWLTGETT
ncbi:uncharacterized protein LOC135474860 isoform X2 [Liolophura sinensis]|uniref:uncharacterized protein LOC135474860 isoform X2 n=1 Tax=Liolophura sinensis TaxID=3198878 RepID=UPI003158990A